MTKTLAVLLMLMLLVIGCSGQADAPTVVTSVMAATDLESQENESVIRVGARQEMFTAGIQSHFIGIHGEDQWYGAFVTQDLGQVPVAGDMYYGYQVGIPTEDEDGGYHGPILGTRRLLAPDAYLVTEGWYRSFNGELKNKDYVDQWKALLGFEYRW